MPDTPTALRGILNHTAEMRGLLDIVAQEHANYQTRHDELSGHAGNLAETMRVIRDKLLKYAEPGSTAPIDITDLVDAHDLAAQAFAATPGKFKQGNEEDTLRLEFLMKHCGVQDRAALDNLRHAKAEITEAPAPTPNPPQAQEGSTVADL